MRIAAAYRALPRPLQIFIAVDLLLLTVALGTEAICHRICPGFPYRSPLLNEHFPDLLSLRVRFQSLHTLTFFSSRISPPWMYPSAPAWLYFLVFLFRPYDLAVLLGFTVLSSLGAALLFGNSLVHSGAHRSAVALLLLVVWIGSFPLWFEMKQANTEILIWFLLAVGVWCFLKGKGFPAAVCFGIAGAMKLYPLAYLGLFLARKQYRQMLYAILTAALVTVSSLWLVYPHVLLSWRLSNQALAKFREVVMIKKLYPQTAFDHSLFALIKVALHPLPPPAVMHHLLDAYMAISVLGGLILFFVRIRKLPVCNQVLCLCVACILLPPTSFDYTLMHLYVPWALLALLAVQAKAFHKQFPGLIAAFICFAILFVPETEFIYHAHSYGGQIKALALLALFVIGLYYPFGPLDQENQAPARTI